MVEFSKSEVGYISLWTLASASCSKIGKRKHSRSITIGVVRKRLFLGQHPLVLLPVLVDGFCLGIPMRIAVVPSLGQFPRLSLGLQSNWIPRGHCLGSARLGGRLAVGVVGRIARELRQMHRQRPLVVVVCAEDGAIGCLKAR